MIRRFFDGPEPPKFHLLLIGVIDVIVAFFGALTAISGFPLGWWMTALLVVHAAVCLWRFRRAAQHSEWRLAPSAHVTPRSAPHPDGADDE